MMVPDNYDLPQYSQPESTLDCVDDVDRSFIMRYDNDIRSKFKFSFLIIGLFFLWGLFFISDPGWLSLGVTIFLIMLAFYKFRIDRVVEIDQDGICEKALFRQWHWPWDQVFQINRKLTGGIESEQRARRMERIIIVHESGREVAIDSHMKKFPAAWKFIWRQSREYKIPLDTQEVAFFLLYYW